MAYQNSTVSFEKMLLNFVLDEDPMQAMLKWLCAKLMEASVEGPFGTENSERTNDRRGYRSGYRIHRFSTRMETIDFLVPKIRNGGYWSKYSTA